MQTSPGPDGDMSMAEFFSRTAGNPFSAADLLAATGLDEGWAAPALETMQRCGWIATACDNPAHHDTGHPIGQRCWTLTEPGSDALFPA